MSKNHTVSDIIDTLPEDGRLKLSMPVWCDYGVIQLNSFRMMLSRQCKKRGIVVVTWFDESDKILHIFKVK